ncbi:MAG: hypothetical protein ACRDHN_15715, partial [Thermomicrobiales bacterium]
MNTIISKMKRTAQIGVVAAFALTLLPVSAGARTTEPLDVGAAVLMPSDAAAIGYEDYGVYLGS